MSRPVTPDESDLDSEPGDGVRIRLVEREGTGMPSEDDLRIVHDVLESAFEDHFNSHEETFDEFVFRLREDPGHRWDHWWIAELVDGTPPSRPAPSSARSRRARATSPTAATSSTSGCSPTPAAAGSPSRCWHTCSPTPPPGT